MVIETKFNPGDNVWFVLNSKAVNYTVYTVRSESTSKESSNIEYFVKKDNDIQIIKEMNCFKNREDLIANI